MIDKLVLGTVQLGLNYGINNQLGKPSLEKAFEILDIAFFRGIQILDTAEAYGDSQKVIGDYLNEHKDKTFKIITKLSANSNVKPEEFLDHLNHNCETLNISSIYGYMFHNYNSFKEKIELYDKFHLAKEQGIISKAGISLYDNNEIEDIITNYDAFDFIQIPFNLFDNASKRKELLEKAKLNNIEVHTRSVFLQGLFFKPFEALNTPLDGLVPYLKELDEIKSRYKINTEALALQYVLQKDYIDHVLVGVETPEQLNSNIEFCKAETNLPHNELDDIDVKEIRLLNPSNWN